jgi:DNA polymerase-3 subunit delta
MVMKYKELLERIKRGKIEPLYLFSGEEEYLKEEVLQRIKNTLIAPGLEEFDYEVLYGKDIDAGALIDKARTLPLGPKKRMIVVRGEEQMRNRESLTPYLKNPLPSTCLIFISREKVRQNKFYSAFGEQEVIFWPLFDNEAANWIRKRVAGEGKKIGGEEIVYLGEIASNNLSFLNQELEKLFLYLGEREKIERKDIESVIGEGWANTLFNLGNALLRKERQRALKILPPLIQKKGELVKIVSRLTQQFRTLWQVKILLAKGYSPPQARESLRLKKRYFSNLFRGTSLFSEEELGRIFESFLNADLKLKTSKESPNLIFELLIIEICSPSPSLNIPR